VISLNYGDATDVRTSVGRQAEMVARLEEKMDSNQAKATKQEVMLA
jgi:acid phosphatase family membrane protein YuiD